jgi:beta-galactosidase
MFRFGADYYPEHWPRERWPVDAQLMQEAGINTVRLAEFAWSYLEPHAGCFDFGWLDDALEILYRHGIQAVLGTPTASPPPWVMAQYPDAYLVPEAGQRLTFGNRREYCPTHSGYRELGRRITAAMAGHYAQHPAVIGWQIDNEFGDRCYCPICRAEFQTWLRAKYGSLDVLNAAWGTIFWSHVYTEWSQIPVPARTGGVPNPGLDLDFRRFMSDAYVKFQQEQVDILRPACPGQFITHNFMGFGYDKINYFDLARPLDFVAWDNYPRFRARAIAPGPMALSHDTMRGLKGRNFWVMEEQSGPSGWTTVDPTPRPGEIRLWTYQAIAHGADAIVYFRWRTARFGTEQHWHGILDHDGVPRRRYREIKAIGVELARIGDELVAAESRPRVALLLSYDTRFAFQIQPNQPDFSYYTLFNSYYAALHRRNIGVDLVPPDADLGRYQLVVAPALYVLDDATASALAEYVRRGGVLLTTARAGVKDVTNTTVNLPLPGLLAEVCGVEVDEYDSLRGDQRVPVTPTVAGLAPAGQSLQASLWCDVLAPTTAQALAHYAGEYYAGRPAITLNRFGTGRAVYVGALGDDALHDAVIGWVAKALALRSALVTAEGVEAVERWQGDQRLLFVLNHADGIRQVSLPTAMRDLLTGETLTETVSLAPKAVLILRE